ncbi:glycosyltransferase family 2 protein, partial [Streptococcus pyogenes]
MKISIITATYNREKLLSRLYKSLCEQTCKDFEWIVIDDGSVDDT